MAAVRPVIGFLFAAALPTAVVPGVARAAESYDNCTGFIDSVPTVVATQGTFCLRHDLATAMTSGRAIDVTANNVTIDCNGFKVGGLAAGPASQAQGIAALANNLTVRGCSVRGFWVGIQAVGSGHVIEDNRVEGSLAQGIFASGSGGVIRRNVVLTTGGSSFGDTPYAIRANQGVDVLGNTVDGVDSGRADVISLGISVLPSTEISVAGNRVRNISSTRASPSVAIHVGAASTGSASLRGNTLGNSGGGGLIIGILCHSANDIPSDNHIVGFLSHMVMNGCTAGPNNVPP